MKETIIPINKLKLGNLILGGPVYIGIGIWFMDPQLRIHYNLPSSINFRFMFGPAQLFIPNLN